MPSQFQLMKDQIRKTVISSQQKEEKWLMIALSDDERQCTSDEVS